MGKLKECPCCENTNIIHANFGYARHTVMCCTCELSTGYMLSDDEAEEAWNSRPKEDALQIRIMTLEQELKNKREAMDAYIEALRKK